MVPWCLVSLLGKEQTRHAFAIDLSGNAGDVENDVAKTREGLDLIGRVSILLAEAWRIIQSHSDSTSLSLTRFRNETRGKHTISHE